MADDRQLQDKLLDVALYAPVGVVLSIVEDLPELAERGRERVNKQVQVARVLGRLAVKQAERWAGKTGLIPTHPGRPDAPKAPAPAEERADGAVATLSEEDEPGASESTDASLGLGTMPAHAEAMPSQSAGSLPIPGYDTLAASQVVQRLSSLRPDELEAVRQYEMANRGRRTILHRIGQLSSTDGRNSA